MLNSIRLAIESNLRTETNRVPFALPAPSRESISSRLEEAKLPTQNGTSCADTLDLRGKTADYTVYGRGGNDTIFSGSGHDKLYGGGGKDLIYAATEDALINGGQGVDTVSFRYSPTGVRVELWDGGLGAWPENLNSPTYHSKVIARVENVVGSIYADHIYGSQAVNKLNGGAGNDYLGAYGSGDFLTGGTGADRFVLTAVTGKVTITDFHYLEGDRLDMDAGPNLTWVSGSAPDANGVMQQAWTATCDFQFGGSLQIVVLGADTSPSTDWFM